MDKIVTLSTGGTMMDGPKAVNVFRLATIASGLRLEIKCPGMKMSRISALQAAKATTGLRTNKRDVQLARIELMLEQAKTEVVYVDSTTTHEG